MPSAFFPELFSAFIRHVKNPGKEAGFAREKRPVYIESFGADGAGKVVDEAGLSARLHVDDAAEVGALVVRGKGQAIAGGGGSVTGFGAERPGLSDPVFKIDPSGEYVGELPFQVAPFPPVGPGGG